MTSALARKFKLDVGAYNSALSSPAAGYTPFLGITDLGDNFKNVTEDTTDYDSGGWAGAEKTGLTGTITIKARRPIVASIYDPGQEIVRAARLQYGDQARVFVRWYDRNGGPEAYAGVAIVEWNRSKTGTTNVEEITVTLTFDGIVSAISNPYVPTAAPVIAAILPSGQGTGKAIEIEGSGFTGATAVTIGIAAASFSVINDQLIEAVLASASAGSVNVTVTTPAGTSAAVSYTRAA